MKILRVYLSILMTILMLLPATISYGAEPLDEVRNLVAKYYYQDVPESVLNSSTIQDLTGQLDRYSVYMTKEEYDSFTSAIERKLVGIGVTIEEHERGIKITSVIKGGPAEKSGLKPGDIILSANGQKLAGESVQTAITFITGKENTTVSLQVYRTSTNETMTKTLTRQVIELPNIEKRKLAGDIGYIRLNSFSLNAGEEVQAAISSMPGMKGWIFDLRDNTGGYVSAAQDVLGLFPKVKEAYKLTYKGNVSDVIKPMEQKTTWNAPVSLLINSMSASASEITAVSVKDQKAAKIYGQKSYGKGVMQGLFSLSDQGMLKLTIAEFFGPNGTAVQGKGVKPDVETPVGKEIIYSHRDYLLSELKTYKKMPALNKVPTNKVFTIKTSSSMNWNTLKSSNVSLIELGNQKQNVKIQKTKNKQLKVTPTKHLKLGANYLLILDPKTKKSKTLVTEVTTVSQ